MKKVSGEFWILFPSKRKIFSRGNLEEQLNFFKALDSIPKKAFSSPIVTPVLLFRKMLKVYCRNIVYRGHKHAVDEI
jgi:hypothetical protein